MEKLKVRRKMYRDRAQPRGFYDRFPRVMVGKRRIGQMREAVDDPHWRKMQPAAVDGIVRDPQCCLLRRNSFFDSVISIITRAPTAQIPSSSSRSGVVRNTVLKNGT